MWVAPETRFTDGDAHWRNRLREGLEHDLGLVIAKAILGRIKEGADPRTLVRETVLFGARNRDDWGTGLTILTALANLLPMLPPEQTGSSRPPAYGSVRSAAPPFAHHRSVPAAGRIIALTPTDQHAPSTALGRENLKPFAGCTNKQPFLVRR